MAFIPIPSILAAAKRNKELGVGRASGAQSIYPLGITLLILFFVGGIGLMMLTQNPIPFILCVLAGFYIMFTIRVADQWEKAVVLRMGRFQGLRGPGMFYILPIIDSVSRVVDQPVRVTDVTAESALTRDNVPVNVDAIVYWVENFFDAIALGAQTAHARQSARTNWVTSSPAASTWARNCNASSMKRPTRGASPCNRSKSSR